jgi:glycosyltransferase involved in cell wall biosynthesis
MAKVPIDFVWQGITERKEHWKDGLWAAMQILEKVFDVEYKEPWDDIRDDATILYWEAPCTVNGRNAPHYNRIHELPNRKILLFAGGPIKKEWVQNFDLLAVESQVNEKECEVLGIPHKRAFGINTDIFKPIDAEKIYLTVTHGTCATWKRQDLVCRAVREDALVFGQKQSGDSKPFDICRECESDVLSEVPYEKVNQLLNKAWVSVNCADAWGGGQRATLEAMACNLPVVVMNDSLKNIEFVRGAGIGLVVDPQPEKIYSAVVNLKGLSGGRDYVMDNWTPQHYADSLKELCS